MTDARDALADPAVRARHLAEELLGIGAVVLAPDDPFRWASGLHAPIYCDNRLTLGYPRLRRALTDGFAALLRRHALAPDVVVGTATAGIPHAAWLADRLDLPMAYVRSKAKAHGRQNQIEGRLAEGQRVVVVEDLVSTGGSSLAAVEAVRAAGVEVLAVVAIFTYGLPGTAEQFAEAGVPLFTLTNFGALLEAAAAHEALSAEALDSLRAWQRAPAAWSESAAAGQGG